MSDLGGDDVGREGIYRMSVFTTYLRPRPVSEDPRMASISGKKPSSYVHIRTDVRDMARTIQD